MDPKLTVLIKGGLRIMLDEENHKSSVIYSPEATGDIVVPKLVKHNDIDYPVVSIKDRAFSKNIIESLSFPEDSQITTFETFSFTFARIKKLQIPSSLKILQENWCYNFKDLIHIEVSPQSKYFRDYNNQYLLGKSNENSDSFNILYFASFNITEAQIPPEVKVIKSYSLSDHDQIKSIIFSENSELRKIEYKFQILLNSLKLIHLNFAQNFEK